MIFENCPKFLAVIFILSENLTRNCPKSRFFGPKISVREFNLRNLTVRNFWGLMYSAHLRLRSSLFVSVFPVLSFIASSLGTHFYVISLTIWKKFLKFPVHFDTFLLKLSIFSISCTFVHFFVQNFSMISISFALYFYFLFNAC